MPNTKLTDNDLAPLLLNSDVGVISGLQCTTNKSPNQNAPLTLLLHGAGGGARSLAKLAQSLQLNGPLLIPDLNGYGRTKLNPEITVNQNALTQHRTVIDHLLKTHLQPNQPVTIIGHSMGGFLGLLTTLSKQWLVTKVIAIEPVAFSVLESAEDKAAQTEDLEKVLALAAAFQRNEDPEQALAQFIAYWNGVAWEELPEAMREALLQQAAQISADTLAVARDTTSAAQYQTLDLPVLLIQGALTPPPTQAVIKRLGTLLPTVETQFVENAGHMGPVQQPKRFAPVINHWLQQESIKCRR